MRFLNRLKGEAAGVFRIVRTFPSTLVWPLLLLGLVLGLGIWGVNHVARVEERSNRDQAYSLAVSAAVSFTNQLTAAISPVYLMRSIVLHNPQYNVVQSIFNGLAPTLLSQTGNITQAIEYAPNGYIRDVYPDSTNGTAIGFNIFAAAPPEAEMAIRTVRGNVTALEGPYNLVEGGHGLIARTPIFITDADAGEDFGLPGEVDPACGDPCAYNATSRVKFWGFAAAVVHMEEMSAFVANTLSALELLGFQYTIRGLGFLNDTEVTIASSSVPPYAPVSVTLPVADKQFTVDVAPTNGWRSFAYGGLLAGVIVLAVVLAVLMFAALVSRKRHQMLLEALLPKDVIRDLHDTDTTLLDARILQAETTADLMLALLNHLLEGRMPDLRDVVFIRQAIIRGVDLYQPTDLTQHIRNANLDKDVARALMQQLGETNRSSAVSTSYDALCDDEGLGGGAITPHAMASQLGTPSSAAQHTLQQQLALQQQQQAYSTLSGALALILAPHPTSLRDAHESTSGIADPTGPQGNPPTTGGGGYGTGQSQQRDLDTAGSPGGGQTLSARLPSVNFVSRAITFLREGPNAGVTAGTITRESLEAAAGGGGAGALPAPAGDQAAAESMQQHSARSRPTISMVELPANALAGPGGVDDDSDPPCASAASATARDDSVVPRCAAVRRAPRRVASALGPAAFGANGSMRRRSLLLSLNNSTITAATCAAGAAGMSGGGSHATSGGATLAQQGGTTRGTSSRRVSVASALDMQQHVPLPPEAVAVGATSGEQPLPLSGSRIQMMTVGASRRNLAAGAANRAPKPAQALPPPPPPPPPPAMLEEVERLLAMADSWQFDTWRLRDITNGHALSALGFYLIQRAGLLERFQLRPVVLARLLRHIEGGYNDNPYHNATHAADVLQTLHVIIHGAQLHVHYLEPLGLLAAYFAAIVHDYGHPGLTNDFLVATSDPLAVRYNDKSPLENHHAAASFGLMQRPGLDVLAPLSKAEKTAFRKQVIEMVLATDVKQHFALLSQFNTAHRLASFAHSTATAKTSPATRVSGNLHLDLDLKEIVVEAGHNDRNTAPKPLDDTERMLSLQLAIKAADLGHLGEELDVHQRWLSGLEEEFFRQGDRERQLGIPISPLFDRSKQGVSKSQVGFYDFVALPLVHALVSAFPGTQPLMTCFLGNYHYWKGIEGNNTVIGAAPAKLRGTSVRPEASSSQLPDLLEKGKGT